jgi:hypothetical protein
MSDLDFSDLTDDQVVSLAAALAGEALRRSPAVVDAMRAALLSEKERAEAAVKGAALGRERARQHVIETTRRAAQEQADEELRQKRLAALAVLLRRAALLTGRDVSDVTIVWGAHYSPETKLYLNPGTSTETVGALHLVEYAPGSGAIKTSWALAQKKADLLGWAIETSAALRALGIKSGNFKGVEL